MKGLIDNAFFFLSGALQQLESDTKRSVIDFYTAVELFLKARLLGEHWTLIVASKPELQEFASGDFQSVTFKDAIERFHKVLGQPIPQDAVKAFDRVRKHRNRLVHFYQPDESPTDLSVIAIEQLKAWHHLNRLITGEWASSLPPGASFKASSIERHLTRHVKYAEQVYHHVKPKIDEEKAKGTTFATCPFCSMDAAQQIHKRPWLRDLDCWVCGSRRTQMDFECPNCQTTGPLNAYEAFKCQHCQHTIETDEFYNALDEDLTPMDEYMEAVTPANCDECQSYHSVCEHQGEYLCAECLSAFTSVWPCEWCGEHGTEERENSAWTGCEHCDGKAGYTKDE